jgi:hypothetical protein
MAVTLQLAKPRRAIPSIGAPRFARGFGGKRAFGEQPTRYSFRKYAPLEASTRTVSLAGDSPYMTCHTS